MNYFSSACPNIELVKNNIQKCTKTAQKMYQNLYKTTHGTCMYVFVYVCVYVHLTISKNQKASKGQT